MKRNRTKGKRKMSDKYIQVGVTALRDPATGDFLPSVPLYIRAEDAEKPIVPKTDGGLMKELSAKMKEYHLGLMREGLGP